MSIYAQYELGVAETPDEIREQIQDFGYANIPVGVTNQDTHELFRLFKGFVELTEQPGGEALKDAVAYKARPEDQLLGNESYFIDLRIPGAQNPHEDSSRGVGKDHKYIFHFGPQTVTRSNAKLAQATPPEMSDLLGCCEHFYQAGRDVGRLGAAALGLSDVLFARQSNEVHHLRLIDYIASANGEHAEAHFDRSVVTAAINESHPGLRGLPADNGYLVPIDALTRARLEAGLQPVSHKESVAKFFGSAGLRRLPEAVREAEGLNELPIFAHDVVNERPGVNRQAVVMFFNPHLSYPSYTVPSKAETSVRLPEDDELAA